MRLLGDGSADGDADGIAGADGTGDAGADGDGEAAIGVGDAAIDGVVDAVAGDADGGNRKRAAAATTAIAPRASATLAAAWPRAERWAFMVEPGYLGPRAS